MIADIVDVARDLAMPFEARVPAVGRPATEIKRLPILGIEETCSEYYLRITANDKPGVLSQISKVFVFVIVTMVDHLSINQNHY